MAEKLKVTNITADNIKERDIVSVSYKLHQQIDAQGQPAGITRGGEIIVTVRSSKDGNTDILEWMCDPYMSKNGTITFVNRNGEEMKKLNFKDGYVVEYSESFEAEKPDSQVESFTISAKEIQVGNVKHNNRWTIDD